MRAILVERFGDPKEVARCADLPDPPAPGPGRILIGMKAMAIAPADLLTIEGRYGVKPNLPFTPGVEGVGEVLAIGPEVTGVSVGDVVVPMAGATWVEKLVTRAQAVIRLPRGVDLEQAAMLKANPMTALVMLTTLVPLQPGDWVIQNAANSAVGQYVCQLAKERGLRTVNLVRRAEAAEPVRAAGGDVVLVEGDGPIEQRMLDATGDIRPKLALDAVAGEATNSLAACLAEGGLIANYGLLSGKPCMVDPHQLVFRDIRLNGFWLAPWFQKTERAEIETHYRALAEALANGRLRAEVAGRYRLDRIGEAMAAAAGSARNGKILLVTET